MLRYLLILGLMMMQSVQCLYLNEDGTVRDDVVSLCRAVGYEGESTLDAVNAWGQKNLLRKGSERQSAESLAGYNALVDGRDHAALLQQFTDLGLLEAVEPSQRSYQGVLLMGSTVGGMRDRLAYFLQLVEDGYLDIKPDTPLIFMTGDRRLFTSETPAMLMNPVPLEQNPRWRGDNIPTNENDLGEWIWNQTQWPSAVREMKPVFLKAQKRQGEARARTEDTVKALIASGEITPGRYVILSENPFVHYQQLTTEVTFAKANADGFTFEGVGPSAARYQDLLSFVKLGVLYDNLARTLYTEVQKRKAQE